MEVTYLVAALCSYNTPQRSAILQVNVPAMIIRSLRHGPADGTPPQRALDEELVDRRDREHEGDLHLEDHEDQRDQIEARIEVEPGLPDGLLAALVDHRLLAVGSVGPQKAPREQRSEDEEDRRGREEQHVGEVKRHEAPSEKWSPR